ncbi:tryptophan decarboxylase-like [Ptychodera flava]|uniref:tryptophan decarboxylase-like n=1 Tax=Ptychodera flava TaxID=63121 RepID=UPI003969F872
MDTLEKKLEELEEISMTLEPDSEERMRLTQCVNAKAEKFLKGLAESESKKVVVKAKDKSSSVVLNTPFSDDGTDIEELMDLYEDNVQYSGICQAHAMSMSLVHGGGLYVSALGRYYTSVLDQCTGALFNAPEGARLEKSLISWAASLIGYQEEHAGTLTSGGTSSIIIAIATARDSMKLKARDFERCVVYMTELCHFSFAKAMRLLSMHDVIVRDVPMNDNMEMDASKLRDLIEKDKERGLRPFLVAASAGTAIHGSVDPLERIADVVEQHNLWLHIDAIYGGFFVLVDDVKHLFKGMEKADSVSMAAHKGLFLPNGCGMILVKDGLKLFRSNVTPSETETNITSLSNTAKSEEFSLFQISFECTRPERGLQLWLPLKVFGVKAFAACLEEKIFLAKYFHQKIIVLEGFMVDVAPVLSVVVFYYDTKNDKNRNQFNEDLQNRITEDGRVSMSSVSIKGKFCLRICVLNFRTHREHIDLAIKIIEENATHVRKNYGL